MWLSSVTVNAICKRHYKPSCKTTKSCSTAALQHDMQCLSCASTGIATFAKLFHKFKNWRMVGFNFMPVVLHTRTFHYVKIHCTSHCSYFRRKTEQNTSPHSPHLCNNTFSSAGRFFCAHKTTFPPPQQPNKKHFQKYFPLICFQKIASFTSQKICECFF